jgi:hypothetical protein
MRRFRYVLDPLCLIACGLYAVNRFWLRGHIGGPFLTGQFNDLFLIPAALPLLLWVQRKLGIRHDDRPPQWGEIAMHLVVWSVAAELVAPLLFTRATGDWRDVVAYTVGAIIAGAWWQVGVLA